MADKILKLAMGQSAGLSSLTVNDPGRILFVTDTGKMLIDVDSNNRVQLNAYNADHADEASTADRWKNIVNFSITSVANDNNSVSVDGSNSTARLSLPTQLTGLSSVEATTFNGKATTAITAEKTQKSLTIKLNDVSQGAFNGSADKSINITPSSIGALANTVLYAGAKVAGGPANSVQGVLTFGTKSYDGSENRTITASDLGLGNALHFRGVSKTTIMDGSATPSGGLEITGISGKVTQFNIGDVVLYNNLEYIYIEKDNGAVWEVLGDENSYVLKTISVTGTGALSGGGVLSSNQQIKHNTYNSSNYTTKASTTTISGSDAQGTLYIPKLTVDTYGHITYSEDTAITITMPKAVHGLTFATSTDPQPTEILQYSYNPTQKAENFILYNMKGATTLNNGTQGLVPAPAQLTTDDSGDVIYTFLAADGEWRQSQVTWGSF